MNDETLWIPEGSGQKTCTFFVAVLEPKLNIFLSLTTTRLTFATYLVGVLEPKLEDFILAPLYMSLSTRFTFATFLYHCWSQNLRSFYHLVLCRLIFIIFLYQCCSQSMRIFYHLVIEFHFPFFVLVLEPKLKDSKI